MKRRRVVLIRRSTTLALARSSRLRAAASWRTGTRQRTEICWNSPKRATSRFVGRAVPGVCHNCESGLVSGDVAYDPEPLDNPAAGNLLVCCSRPIRDVVIDL